MTTLTLSPRIKTIFKRFVEVEADNMIQHIKTLNDDSSEEESDREESVYAGVFVMKMCGGPGAHNDSCQEDGFLAYGETCSHCNHTDAYMHVSVAHRDHSSPHNVYLAHRNYDVKYITKDTLYGWVETLLEEWCLCQCHSVATIRGMCKSCYIHGYQRTEEQGGDCCVCHENNGRWIRYRCGHEIHLHCHRRIEGKKCPLCRAIVETSATLIDPYDI